MYARGRWEGDGFVCPEAVLRKSRLEPGLGWAGVLSFGPLHPGEKPSVDGF